MSRGASRAINFLVKRRELPWSSSLWSGIQGRLTRLLRRTHGNFVLDADHAGHPTHDRLGAGPLVRPFDYALQGNHAAIHFRGHPMTWDREIPMKRICDFGANISHGAPSLLF
jgi:hypothetical protein